MIFIHEIFFCNYRLESTRKELAGTKVLFSQKVQFLLAMHNLTCD